MASKQYSREDVVPRALRIAYIHVPKCGGTSVANALRETYASRRMALVDRVRRRQPAQFTRIDAPASLRASLAVSMPLPSLRSAVLAYYLALDQPGVLKGHVPFSREIGEAFAHRWSFITVLRDPVERFFSEYFYNRHKHSDHFAVQADLDEYLFSKDAIRTSSQLVNFLCGRANDRLAPTDSDMRLAISNLDYFTAIGFMDRLEIFADQLGRAFGTVPRFPVTNRNPAPESAKRARTDPAIRKRVEDLCQADIAVYQAARTRLEPG